MDKEELINELETMRENIKNDLAYVNAKHDVLINELCFINNLLSRAKMEDSNNEVQNEKYSIISRGL